MDGVFTILIKGVVIMDKRVQNIIDGEHRGWCLIYGILSFGFFTDNRGEFRNYKMEESDSKIGIKIEFTPTKSPWSNGINERNHYNADKIVRKTQEED